MTKKKKEASEDPTANPKSRRLRNILKELEQYPKEEIKAFTTAAESVSRKIEEQPDREVDVASLFNGNELFVAELIYKTRKKTEREVWIHTQLIYCSLEKCPKCPHGPYNFEYRARQNGDKSVKWSGTPFFNPRSILAGVVNQWPERFDQETKILNFGDKNEA